MESRFVNRRRELRALEELYATEGFQLIIIHGRRRIGKTTLLRKFIEGKRSVYFVASNVPEKVLLEQMYTDVTQQIGGSKLLFQDVSEFFRYLGEQAKERLLVIFDEFQYMMDSIRGIESIIQVAVDVHWGRTQLFVVLCGSEVRMMTELQNYTNPLYGRRTGQLKLGGFQFSHLRLFFPTLPTRDLLHVWAIFGSTPAYLAYYDPSIPLGDNLLRTVLSDIHPLYDEPRMLLVQEFRETQRYFAVLQKIAAGNTRVIDIANAIGVDARSLPKYLNTLLETDLIEKRTPLGMKERSHTTRYHIKDAFIHFWFRHVHPNRSNMLFSPEPVLHHIMDELPSYVGPFLETACLSIMQELNALGKLPAHFTEIGRWWAKGVEFDVILKNKDCALILETKAGERTVGGMVLGQLRKKIGSTPFRSMEVYYGVVSMGFSAREEGCVTLDELLSALDSGQELRFMKM